VGAALGQVLGPAVGIAISPVPIAAVILMLFSDRARINGSAFVVAWIVGLAAVTTLVSLLPGLESDSGGPSTTAGWVKLGLGALLIVAGLAKWRSRPGPDEHPDAPAWMQRIDTLRPAAASGLGFLLSALNPKNLLLAAAAGVTIAAADLATAQTVGLIAAFTAIASVTVGAPVVAYLVAGNRLDARLDATKSWLIDNNSTVMAVLIVVFGVSLLGDGIEILA
jgi:threonine/homoserine/homoserine lactone efflux protein